MRSALLSLFLIGCFVLSSCTFGVPFTPDPPVTVEQTIPLDVGLHVDQSTLGKVHEQKGLFLLGMGHTWNIETGAALKVGAEMAFGKMFRSVQTLDNAAEFSTKSLTLLITPRVTYFEVSQGLAANMSLQCNLVDNEGKTIYQNTIQANGKGQFFRGCMCGVFGGKAALSKTAEDAFNSAFFVLVRDIEAKVDFSPYL